jgi:hypothetical protein
MTRKFIEPKEGESKKFIFQASKEFFEMVEELRREYRFSSRAQVIRLSVFALFDSLKSGKSVDEILTASLRMR